MVTPTKKTSKITSEIYNKFATQSLAKSTVSTAAKVVKMKRTSTTYELIDLTNQKYTNKQNRHVYTTAKLFE